MHRQYLLVIAIIDEHKRGTNVLNDSTTKFISYLPNLDVSKLGFEGQTYYLVERVLR